MPAFSRQSAPFQLGDWKVDPATGQLTRGAELRRARPLVTELLLYLAARPGEVVTKDELVDGPWGGAAIADSAVTSTIAELRELLDDQPRSPRYIETLPKRGYRLIATVTLAEEVVATPAVVETPPVPAAAPAPAAASASGLAQATGTRAREGRSSWSSRSWAFAFALGVTFAVAAAVLIGSRRRPVDPAAPAPRAMRLTVDLPNNVRLAPDSVPRLALTADGSRMAYVVRQDAGLALYTRTLDQFAATPVRGASEAAAPFFSADGTRIGYFANGELRTVPVSGGEPTIVCPARVPLGGTWTADDAIIFSGTHGLPLFEVPAAGGAPRQLTTLDASRDELSHRWPQILPDDVHVLFTAIGRHGATVLVASRRSGEQHVVLEHAQAAMFIPPNRLMFERDGRVMLTAIDPENFTPLGTPRMVLDDVSPSGPGFGNPLFAVARDGALIYVPNDPHDTDRELVWVDRAGHATALGAPLRSYMHPRLSADGERILTWLRTRDADMWLFDVRTRQLTRIATGVAGRRAVLSPDGFHVLFDARGPDNPVMLYQADVRGGEAQRMRPDTNSQYAGTWTPDGRTIAFLNLTRSTGFDIVTMGTEPNAPMTPVVHSAANETAPAFSPNGRWLAFVSDATGREEVYLLPYPAGGQPLQVSTGGGREPMWSKRGDELFFRQGANMLAVHIGGGTPPRVSDAVTLFSGEFDQRPTSLANYDVAPDGRFLMIRGIAPPATDTRIAVLLRWDMP